MPDIEKVIRGLECVLDAMVQSEHAIAENGVVMSSWQDRAKRIDAIREAIALLKAQEAVEPKAVNMYPHGQYACGNCGHISVGSKDFRANYCPKCGRAVKWE